MAEDRPKTYWFDNPRNVRKVVWAVYIVCALLFLIDFFVPEDYYDR